MGADFSAPNWPTFPHCRAEIAALENGRHALYGRSVFKIQRDEIAGLQPVTYTLVFCHDAWQNAPSVY